jgi:hypothetical protein
MPACAAVFPSRPRRVTLVGMASRTDHARPTLGWGPLAAGGLLFANIVVPLVWGDLYPFTSAPMFRDNPQRCCNYRVLGPDGHELPAEDWLCHRIYDGNPVGYGVGLQPPPVLEQQFGQVASEEQIRKHFLRLMSRAENLGLDRVEVMQEIVGPLPERPGCVGIVETRHYRIERPK